MASDMGVESGGFGGRVPQLVNQEGISPEITGRNLLFVVFSIPYHYVNVLNVLVSCDSSAIQDVIS